MNNENMNDQEINIAIAEACPTIVGLGADGIYYLRTGLVEFDPCNDLNAMHEAEETLTLQKLVDMQICITHFEGILPFHSTARQRAKAFLRAIGKWKEAAK